MSTYGTARLNQLGDEQLLYYDSAGTWGTETWVKQDDIQGLTFDPSRKQIEIPKRSYVQHRSGRAEWMLNFTINVSPEDTFYIALLAAMRAGTSLHLAVADGVIATDGTIYHHADWIFRGEIDGQLDSPATIDVEARVDACSSNTPAVVTVSA